MSIEEGILGKLEDIRAAMVGTNVLNVYPPDTIDAAIARAVEDGASLGVTEVADKRTAIVIAAGDYSSEDVVIPANSGIYLYGVGDVSVGDLTIPVGSSVFGIKVTGALVNEGTMAVGSHGMLPDRARLSVTNGTAIMNFVAAKVGSAGNDITIEVATGAGALSISVTGNAIRITLASGGSTAAAIQFAWTAAAAKLAVFIVKTGGTFSAAIAATQLAGGVDWIDGEILAQDSAAVPNSISLTKRLDNGGHSLLGYSVGGGDAANARAFRGDNSALDYPLPPPRYSDKNLLSIIVDDTSVEWLVADGGTAGALGGLTPYAYAKSKGIPITWGAVADYLVTGAPNPSAAQIMAYIADCGGEVACHSYTHVGRLNAQYLAGGSLEDKDWRWHEIVEAKAKIEELTYFPCLSYLHVGWGAANVVWPDDEIRANSDDIMGALLRANFIAVRGTGNHPAAGSQRGSGQAYESYSSTYPMSRRYPADNVMALNWGVGANADALATRFVANLINSNGIARAIWFHAVGTTAGVQRIQATAFKLLVDALSAELNRTDREPLIDIVPFHQLAYTQPCAVGRIPNKLWNAGFEGCQGAGAAATYLEEYDFDATFGPIHASPGNGAILTVNSGAHTGTYYVSMEKGAAATTKVSWVWLDAIPGEQYTLSWWQNALEAGGTITATITFGGSGLSDRSYAFAAGETGSWVRRQTHMSAPANTTSISIALSAIGDGVLVGLDDVFFG